MTTKDTTEAPQAAPEATSPDFQAELKRILASVGTNPAKVEFPRDQWGMTTELRKAGLRAASSIRGSEEKQRIFLATLQVLAAHAKARIEDDRAELQRRLERAAKVERQERVYGVPKPAPKTEDAVEAK